ncbi:MAG TPA: roadblock/LC7 domain-containing protein [Jiangellaceae bacterium]|nr:roadblock/LC7 domain-containing protein [Jiangellaceae bacterium]
MTSAPNEELGWLLERFVDRTPGAAHAVVVSADGLHLAGSKGMPRDRGEQLAAVVSGLASLTIGASMILGAGRVQQTLVEMAQGYLLVMAIRDGAHLAVLAASEAELGQVGYEMALLVERVGAALSPAARVG